MDQPTVFLGMRWLDIITIVAVLVGPILAVVVTRLGDNRREALDRKTNIFRALMRTRSIRLDPEHVGALNLVEVEFYGNQHVLNAYREYIKNLGAAMPQPDDQDRFFEARQDLFVDLLKAIALALGYQFDKHDFGRNSYAPSGWESAQSVQRLNASLISELLQGKRSLPITPMPPQQNNPFPPPPTP